LELGERRRVTLEVWLTDGGTFQPENCKWQLLFGSTAESEGDCDVEQNGTRWRLTGEVEPKKRTTYRLQYSFQMGTEIVKRTVLIKVV
jgi:N-acetylneuraminic acid mutarotase